MREFYAYHVVTEKPMQIGQHILFDETHHSGVWERVQRLKNTVDDIYAHPEKYQSVSLEYPVQVALRELALEEVRRANYPQYPSRMSCLYVSENVSDSYLWFDYFLKLGRPTYQIVKMKIRGNCFVGDANNCFDGVSRKEENLRQAEHYWQNLPNVDGEPPIREMLVDGDIEVVEIVKEGKGQ